MWLRPFYSVATLHRWNDSSDLRFLGSAFAYRSGMTFLTAAHCVGNIAPSQLALSLPLSQLDLLPITSVILHPAADIAVLKTNASDYKELTPFLDTDSPLTWGDTVQALGFPEESEEHGSVPTARLVTGNLQRFYEHTSSMGYVYRACELSFGAPAGLSGGPVFPVRDLSRVVAVVAENHDSTTYLRSVEEVQENGEVYRQHQHEVIRYGVGVWLADVRDWLVEHTS
jgi:S1-C subfamily serine protease